MTSEQRQRVDKWLWFARLVKTRTKAQALVSSGKVRVNRVKISSPSKLIGPGDVLTLPLGNHIRVVELLALAKKRGPYASAQLLYRDLTEPAAPRAASDTGSVGGTSPDYGKKPDKRMRRKLMALKRDASL